MSYLHDDRDAAHEDDDLSPAPPSELTLGTGTIIGLFFGLALLCGAFFAFGYNLGSKSRQPPVESASSSSSTAPAAATFDHFKPSPGAPAIQPVPGYLSQKEADAANRNSSNSAYNTPGAPSATVAPPNPRVPAVISTPTPDGGPPPPARIAPATPHVTAEPAAPAAGFFNVQVAAVSHQEDADLLVNALKRKGYAVAERTEVQDKLFHIQVGPFPSKKEAEAMRQRLLSDGYNAILK